MSFKFSLVLLFICITSTTIGLKLFDPARYTRAGKNDMIPPQYPYKEAWTDKIFPVDHFSNTNTDKFKLKYLYDNSTYKSGGPIFFYAGNEGFIEGFADNTGIIWDIAGQFNAFVVFAEHRYYGETMPYGNATYSYSDISKLQYLTSTQALADYAMFLPWFKQTWKLPADTPVIVFGGSYGGMLATWFRMKYPDLTAGSWASSAPVRYFHNTGVDVGAFDAVVKNTFNISGCNVQQLNRAFQIITEWGKTVDGRQTLSNIFPLDPRTPLNSENDVAALKLYFQNGMEYMAMTDYPYQTAFLNPMPAWPVKTGCDAFSAAVQGNTDDTKYLQGLLSISNIYYNSTGQALTICLDSTLCGGIVPGSLDSEKHDGWDFQECTEIVYEICALGWPNDFFDSNCNSTTFLQYQSNFCNNIYGPIGWTPSLLNENAIQQEYGFDFSNVTNIIFTNGVLDPWSAGGVKAGTPGIGENGDPSRGIYVYNIDGSAHHLDFRQPASCDPDSVVSVRVQAVQIITCWINPSAPNCPFQPYPLPTFTNMNPNTNCSYLSLGGYPWSQPPPSTTPASPLTTSAPGSTYYGNGTITSPNYPQHYPSNLNATYILQATPGKRIKITFNRINTEQCCDIITVYDGQYEDDSKIIKVLSGDHSTPESYQSSDTYMTIRFITDAVLEEEGFTADFISF